MPSPQLKNKRVKRGRSKRVGAALSFAALCVALSISCNKKVAPPPLPERVIEYVVKDSTITIPADTHELFLRWSELCDTSLRITPVPVAISTKKNKLTNIVRLDSSGVTFICREDSLLQVIQMLRQTTTSGSQIETNKEGRGLTDYTILFLAVAVGVFGLVMLFRK